MSKITPGIIKEKKLRSEPIVLLTAYGFALARIIDSVGIDIILVGDSLANTELGLESTRSVSMSDMIHHAKAVARGVTNSLLIGDMPYEAYQVTSSNAVLNARRFMEEAGCDGVKIEWFKNCVGVVRDIIAEGIPVMGHIGLTPQTADELGGFKVQGADAGKANILVEQAVTLQGLGVFSIVLECVPDTLARFITEALDIPTIGIGAGPHCDGQALVSYDMLGITRGHKPRFVKQYVDIYSYMEKAISDYKNEVKQHIFPSKEYSYSMKKEEADKFRIDKNLR
jgi:3-methyl-2-oxobutanoate hydroxymethyltransferase